SGRWLEKEDNGSFVGVVSANQFTPAFTKAPVVGDKVTVEVPAFSLQNGEWIADYTNSSRWEIDIVGAVSVVTRSVDYSDPIGGLITEKVYAYYSDIYLPLDTWQMIWQQAANGAAFQPAELLLQVKDLTFLEDRVYDLQQKYPQYSFVSMPNQLNRVLATLSLEPVIPRLAQEGVNAKVTLLNQTVLSADLRLPLTLLVLLNAGLLVAANILILVSERKKEIGVLKAIGAKRLDIIIMILGEVILVTAVGSGIGFFFIRIQSLLNQMTNPSSFVGVLLLFTQDFLIVMCATSCLAVVFGFIPAWNYAKLSVMEVLRNE
ncbi:MAG TPA: ABC transporter permease, partial [Bacillota bacterium]|nr:ABC transporter permease [Bacillota bacterium]